MKKKTLTTKLFSLSCEDQPGMLSVVIAAFNEVDIKIETLSQARTDVAEIILITIEAAIPGVLIDDMLHRLQTICGVLDVTITFGSVLRTAIFRIKPRPQISMMDILNKYNARVLHLEHAGVMLIYQIDRISNIQRLYTELDSSALIGFCQQPLVMSQPLSWEEIKNFGSANVALTETRLTQF